MAGGGWPDGPAGGDAAGAGIHVVGSGPNGLAAAVVLGRAGHRVTVYEAADRPGGGARTEALTLPGFVHDVCSAVHPLGAGSPFFRTLPLARHGLEWLHPPVAMAHPFDDGTAAVLVRSPADTGASLGPDAAAYRRLVDPFVRQWKPLLAEALAPPVHLPRHPRLLARLGGLGLRSARSLTRRAFQGERATAFFAGLAAHGTLPLDRAPSAAFGLLLAVAGHGPGWPLARDGSGAVARALAGLVRRHGGRIVTGTPITDLDALPPADAILLDLGPHQVARVAGRRLPRRYRRALERYRYGPGVFKVDWALSDPIPWTAAACRRAGTVHLGGTAAEIAASTRAAWEGRHDDRPFVILAQPTLVDPGRAPAGRHVAWGYAHVPPGSTSDRTGAIEAQIERFAPGFRDTILARSTLNTRQLEAHDANLLGGDINGGVQDLGQLFFRPTLRLDPYRTPVPGLYLCSASTPPGGGVHGMCGYHAATSALRRLGNGAGG